MASATTYYICHQAHRRPVARILPIEQRPSTVFGRMKGIVEILGDIIAPTGAF
jgi:hypothetical protein